MTTRNMTDAMETAIAQGRVRPVIFVEGSFGASGSPDEEFLRLWSGNGSFEWDSKTWGGAGQLLKLSAMEESAEVKAVGFNIELSGLPAATRSLALDNTRQGRPGRVWLGLMGREGYLSLPGETSDYAYTLDSAATSVTADIDMRAKAAADDWTPAATMDIVDKRSVNNISYVLRLIATSGRLNVAWSVDGVTETTVSSTVSPSVSDGQTLWVRATVDFDTGGSPSVYEVKFWTSSDGSSWTQLGSTVTGTGAGAIFDGAARLSVGASYAGTAAPFAGKIYYAEVRSGVGGTAVAVFDPSTDAQQGSTSFTSSATGETWTINQSGSTRAEIVVNENHLIADPYLIRAGRMDYVSISAAGDGTTITAQYEDRLIDLERSRERRYTNEDQQFEYSGDGGFRFVAGLQDKQLIWGGPGAAASPLATPTYIDEKYDDDYNPGRGTSDG